MARKKQSTVLRRKKTTGIMIELVTGVGAVPSTPTAKRNAPAGPPDRVRWWNRTARGETLTFTDWPFVEPPAPIMIKPGAKSGWYHVYSGALDGMYDYQIGPTINPASGPPGEPGIVVQG
jgi:hypothetical protein